jgi:endonuclease G
MGRRIHNLILLTLELYSATVFSQVTTRQSHDRIELPAVTSADSLLIEHTGFSLSYNFDTNCPNWVAWNLTEEKAYSTQFKRSNDFRGDIMVPPLHRVEGYDYKPTEFDRGHMCPAGDMKWNADAMSECFLMSNICPQIPVLNQIWWEHLERACRRWASQERCIYICCGPIYDKRSEARYIGEEVKIRVPDAFFKVVVSLQQGKEKGIGFYYRNDDSRQTMESAALSIDQVEELTGYDFFAELPDEMEIRIEAQNKLSAWR